MVYELTKRSFIMRSLYKDKSAVLQFPLSLVILVIVVLYASITVGMVLGALLVVVVLVCLFVSACFVIVRSLHMSVTINRLLSYVNA